jgi:Putative zinc-finger
MNCAQLRNRLPELLYEDLPAGDREQLQEHLARCPQCRSEYASLQEVQQSLNRVSAPEVSVNLSLLYRQVADHQARAGRRWRRVALGAGGLAAAVIFILVLRLEIQLSGNQVVIRWGDSTGSVEKIVNTEADSPGFVQSELPFPPASEAELLPLREVIHVLAEDMDKLAREVDARDRRQQQSLARLQDQLTQLRMFTQRQISMADSSKKGDDR